MTTRKLIFRIPLLIPLNNYVKITHPSNRFMSVVAKDTVKVPKNAAALLCGHR